MKLIPILILMMPALAVASGECNGHSCNNPAGATATADVSHRSDSLAVGGADYDIGKGSCRFHEGGLTFAWTRADRFCQGIDLIRIGAVEAGKRHICERTDVGANYPDTESCMAELGEMLVAAAAEPEPEDDAEDEHRQALEEQQMLIEDMAAKIRNLEQAKPEVKVIREVDPELQRRLDEDAKRRAATRAILEKGQ